MKKSTFENKVLEFMSNVNDFIKEQKEFNKKIESRLGVLETKVDRIEKDIKDMKSTSTMSKELKETRNK